MELGLNLAMTNWSSGVDHNLALAVEAERLGYSSVWVEEAYGNDAVVPLTWVAALTSRIHVGSAIMQIPARTPASTAMTAATLDLFSRGRFRLGLGVSGPQVAEGWHGQPFDRPLQRTREYVQIVRKVLARDEPVSNDGPCYPLPYPGGTGQGKPLRLILRPLRPDVPIYIGALGPRNVELAAEIADGWLPIMISPESLSATFGDPLRRGFERAGCDKAAGRGFDIAATVPVVVHDDATAARDLLRPRIALYIGGMGSGEANFSNQLAVRLGFEHEATLVRKLFLEGDRAGAIAAVPDELIDQVALCGPRERIADRLEAWKASDVSTLIVEAETLDSLRMLAELVL